MKKEVGYIDFSGEVEKIIEAEQSAAAPTGPSTPTRFEELVLRALDALGYGSDKTEEGFGEIRRGSNVIFELAMSKHGQERFQARFRLLDHSYEEKSQQQAKTTLEAVWKFAKGNNVAPETIIKDLSELNHSSVAMEFVSRVTALQLQKEFAENPRMWWFEVQRAYQSIDFHNLTPDGEKELIKVFENSFAHMRALAAKSAPPIEFPKNNNRLWRGLGDYYFSTHVEDESVSPGDSAAEDRNNQRESLRQFLKDLQIKLQRPNTAQNEKQILTTAKQQLDRGTEESKGMAGKKGKPNELGKWNLIRKEVGSIQRRLAVETEEFFIPRNGGGETAGASAESRAELIEVEERWRNRSGASMTELFADLADELEAFPADVFPEVRRRLIELDEQFRAHSDLEEFAAEDLGELAGAVDTLQTLLRTHGKNMSSEQRAILEKYYRKIKTQLTLAERGEQPPNKLYLTEDEVEGMQNDPIGTVERIFNEAIEALIEDEMGPRARFLMDRLDLIESFLFSPQLGRKLLASDVFIVKSKADLMDAVLSKKKVLSIKQSGVDLSQIQNNIDAALGGLKKLTGERQRTLTVELKNFERQFSRRRREAQFIQVWMHTADANDENFKRVLNSRMKEDDFYGMDGLYGGLVQHAREILQVKYAQKIFDSRGNKQAHWDKLWKEAVDETIREMRDGKNKKRYEAVWNDYMNGRFFKEDPDSKEESALNAVMNAKGATPDGQKLLDARMKYEDACNVIGQFAKFRMIMSGEKYNMDIRFAPTVVGVNADQIPTQFFEKQKIAKLMRRFTAWQLTWGGITQGFDQTERLAMRERSAVWRLACREIDAWGEESAKDYWDKIQRFDKLEEDQQKHLYGQVKTIFSFSVDSFDELPAFSDAKSAGEKLRSLSFKKLLEETRFYNSLLIDETYGLFPYNGFSESGARRRAQFGLLSEVLGGNKDLAKQNFLTFVALESAFGYFHTTKYGHDTKHSRSKFLDEQAIVARYSPLELLFALREGESKPLRAWTDSHVPGGARGFGKHYGELSLVHRTIFRALALGEQVDYSKGLSGLNGFQDETIDQIFMIQHDNNRKQADAAKEDYFAKMKEAADYLLTPKEVTQEYGAISELTNIRYAPLLMKLRFDDYPYEFLQYPERMLSRLGKKFEDIRGKPELENIFLTRITEKTTGDTDEQSGLWRRMWRDLGGMADLFALIGETWRIEPERYLKAQEQTYKGIVGIQGVVAAKINGLLNAFGRLGMQKVYAKYGPLLEGLPDSSPIKKYAGGHAKSKSPDELLHELEVEIGTALGEKTRYRAPTVLPIEAAGRDRLGISSWDRLILGGHSNRAQIVENLQALADKPNASKLEKFIGNFAKRYLTEKNMTDAMEILEDKIPNGVIGAKALMLTAGAALLLVLIIGQEAKTGGGQQQHKSS